MLLICMFNMTHIEMNFSCLGLTSINEIKKLVSLSVQKKSIRAINLKLFDIYVSNSAFNNPFLHSSLIPSC